jgi:hypothetical protein
VRKDVKLLFIYFYVSQAGTELLTSSDLPTSSSQIAGFIGMWRYAQPNFFSFGGAGD